MSNRQVTELANRMDKLEQWRRQSKQPTLGFSAIEDGALQVISDGILRGVIGRQVDGTVTTIDLNADPGPIPDAPILVGKPGFLVVSSYGLTSDASDWPLDFLAIDIHVGTSAGFTFSTATKLGEFTADGGQVAFAVVPGTYYVKLVSRNTSGVLSAASTEASAVVTDLADVVPATAPSESPAVSLTGAPQTIIARADTVAASTLIEYHIWDSTTGDETYVPTQGDLDTLFEIPTRSAVQVIDHLPNGLPLINGEAYYVATWAKNGAGYAPAPSAVAIGQTNMEAVLESVLASVVAGFILTGRIEVGSSYWDADEGLVFLDASGLPFITLPVDGSKTADIYAFIRATGITIEDNANLYGLAQEFGTFRITNGVPDPQVQANLARTWKSQLTNISTLDWAEWYFGLTDNAAGTKRITALGLLGTGSITEIDPSTGVLTGHAVTGFQMIGGITRIGSNYYALGQDSTRSYGWYVYKFDSSFAKTAEWTWAENPASRPAIGNDGTNVLVSFARNNGTQFKVTSFSTTGTNLGSMDCTHNLNRVPNLGGLFSGTADFGASRIVVGTTDGIFAFNSSGVRQTSHEWKVAGGSFLRGMHYDGTRFRHLDDSGRIWDYTNVVTDRTIYGAYSWYDGDTTSGSSAHETDLSSAKSFTQWARSAFTVTGQPAPDVGVTDPSNLDKANLLRIYAGTASGTMRLQGTLSLGETSMIVDTLNTGSAIGPAETNDFSSASTAPGRLETAATTTLGASTVPSTELIGSGVWHLLGECDAVATATASSPFSGTVTFFRIGQLVLCVGNIDRASGSSTSFVDTGAAIPAGFRPPATTSLEAKPFFNSGGNSYRFRANASTNKIDVQMSVANTQNMTLNDWWVMDL